MKSLLSQRLRLSQTITKILLPFVMLFALYVQFHGDFGPGGGFQAGVIFASAFIVHGLVFGVPLTRLVMPPSLLRILMSLGVLIYAGIGVVSIFLGGNYLDYSVLATDAVAGQHLGILIVELGVGITVAAVMISLFYSFSSRRPSAN
ncbi:MAG: multicomponent Na+:H+ antiporter subunit B [Cellvibrionaceae bacterium]|jgi:multicomponent Na+:H+ antiporter subunit B